MENNEIKKALYKEKPIAKIKYNALKEWSDDHDPVNFYETETSLGTVQFRVPVSEMGETVFEDEVPAQLLIRWLV